MSEMPPGGMSGTERYFEQGTRSRPRVWEAGGDLTASMSQDIADGLRRWQLWIRLGWQDVMLRYRRSILGPFWMTLSMGVMVGALGIVYGGILKVDIRSYLPFLTLGFLVWGFISSLVSEGCQTFIESEWLIRQIDLPLSLFPLRVVWRNVLIVLHNVLIYPVVMLLLGEAPSMAMLAAVPGFLVIAANGVWAAALLGMLSARFRDIPQTVGSLMQVAFFISPIIWFPSLLEGDRAILVSANPFFHLIEVVRAPMLGQLPTIANWSVCLGILLVGGTATLLFYRRFHVRIAYWV